MSLLRSFRVKLRARQEQGFDLSHGIETVEYIPVAQLGMTGDVATDAGDYGATFVADFARIMRHLDIDPADYSFVDLGSGKGRALVLAHQAGFARVIGVEADPGLCRIARDNLDHWSEGRHCPIEMVEQDARKFEYPAGNLIVYLYNSFGGAVFDDVLATLIALARDKHRRLILVYNNNRLADRVDATGAFDRRDLRPLIPWRRPTISFFTAIPPADPSSRVALAASTAGKFAA